MSCALPGWSTVPIDVLKPNSPMLSESKPEYTG